MRSLTWRHNFEWTKYQSAPDDASKRRQNEGNDLVDHRCTRLDVAPSANQNAWSS